MSDELPGPLTPADCDLRGLPFMPVDLVRLFDSDIYALSSGEEFKAAFTLWGKAFLQVPAGSLPDDDRVLAHLSGAGARWKRVKDMALKGFVKCSDGRLYHPVVCDKAREAWSHRLRQRERAAKRWQSRGDAAAHAAAYPAAMQGTGTVKRQLRNREESGEGASQQAAPPPPRRACRLNIEILPDDWRAFCQQERADLDPDRTFANFKDYFTSSSGRHAAKLDWKAAWRLWVRREKTPPKASLFDPPKPVSLEEADTWGRS